MPPTHAISPTITAAILTHRIKNWGRAMKLYPRMQTCGSLEGNWRSPQCWAEPEGWTAPPDIHDAWDIETAARIIPVNDHFLLKQIYVYQKRCDVVELMTVRHMRKATKTLLWPRDILEWLPRSMFHVERCLRVPRAARVLRAQLWARHQLSAHAEPA